MSTEVEYADGTLGYSFLLPDAWRVDTRVNPLTFFGPNGRVGLSTEHIQIITGGIGPQYVNPTSREEFMKEPGATVRRGTLGSETNVVVCEWLDHTEISAVRDGVHYNIVHPHDDATRVAVKSICDSFRFPAQGKAVGVLRRSADPSVQTMAAVLNAGSADEARRILASSSAVESVRQGSSGTEYRLRRPHQSSRKWWQFWKS